MAESGVFSCERRKTCCLIGIRLQALHRPADDIKVDLENEILASVAAGYTLFLTGMNCGTDIWAGNIVIRLKDRFPELKLVAAIPYSEFADTWSKEWGEKYHQLLSRADWVKTFSLQYSEKTFLLRNQWMMDHSSKLIAVYNGMTDETRHSFRYARECGMTVKCLKG